MDKINITLLDGSVRQLPNGGTAADLAKSISSSLAQKSVVCKINGNLADVSTVLQENDTVELIDRHSDEALEVIRHDCAHVLAQAVQHIFPDAQPTIGPAIEHGFYYDFYRETPFTPDDLAAIEKRMRQLVQEKIPFERLLWEREQAIDYYQKRQEPYKVELVEAIPAGEAISFYRQGDFLDLCRGPHTRHTGDVGVAFKLTHLAGSYWRGDSKNAMLQRIYGIAFSNEAALKEHLDFLEESKRRDHRNLGRVMGLFHQQDEAAGMIFWHDKGWRLYRELESYIRRRQETAGYTEVKTPQLVDKKLWEMSGHWAKFREHMYLSENEEGLRDYLDNPDDKTVFALKPMNCPCHVQIYKQGVKSYRDLPLRMAEFGNCHRCEPSGALHGIMRVRNFVQDDAHIFCQEEQITAETIAFVRLLESIYKDLGFEHFTVKFSDRPAVRAGSDAVWDRAEAALHEACEQAGVEWSLNAGEGAFYGPKLEFVLKDAIGRQWQCGTWQVDFVLPENLNAEYTNEKGERVRPVMCHRAIIGSFERFIGILLEHHAGHLPLWLSPTQVVVATITQEADGYANEVLAALLQAGIRTELDIRNEKINYKIREHSTAKIPLILTVGKREAEQKTVSVRRLGSTNNTVISLAEIVTQLCREATPPN